MVEVGHAGGLLGVVRGLRFAGVHQVVDADVVEVLVADVVINEPDVPYDVVFGVPPLTSYCTYK